MTTAGRSPMRAPAGAAVGGGFTPWRRAVRFAPVTPAPSAPLLAGLSFIRDPRHRGAPFRFGVFEIPPADFARIADALGGVGGRLSPT